MKVLVCGDRNWRDYDLIHSRLSKLPGGTTIIHGAARGADIIGGRVAVQLGLGVSSFAANWRDYGKAAGPVRNRVMLDTKPDLVIAFHDHIEESKGTADCIREARKRGIPVELISHANSVTDGGPR